MKGIILKDFINLRKNIKLFAVFILIYGLMAYSTQDSGFFSTIFTILCAILTLSLYSYDEMAKWDSFALTMPLSRDNIVQGKFIMMLLLTLIGIGLGALFTIILYIIAGIGSPLSSIKSCMIGAGIAIVFYSIAIPIITKVGVEKARFVLIAVYMIPFVGVMLIGQAIDKGTFVLPKQIIDMLSFLSKNVFLILIAVILVTLGISYLISIRIYRKKQF